MKKKHIAAGFIDAGLFAALAIVVKLFADQVTRVDNVLANALVSSFANFPTATRLLTVVANVFSPKYVIIVTAILLVVVFLQRNRKWFAIKLGILFALPVGLAWVIKKVIARPRPLAGLDGFSFPSGHTIAIIMFVIVTILIVQAFAPRFARPVFNVLLVVILLAVMLSRIVLQYHYPSDLLGSLLLGLSAYHFMKGLAGL